MKGMYLVNYFVKGIKSLDQQISLSFYKKIIPSVPDTQNYNVKGIYGMNGAGKSGIVNSVEILKNLLINSNYLNNPLVQKNLGAMINKKLQQLDLGVDFLVDRKSGLVLFHYEAVLAKGSSGKYEIHREYLAYKKASVRTEQLIPLFEIQMGQITNLYAETTKSIAEYLKDCTKNLLSSASFSSLFGEKFIAIKTSFPNYGEDFLCVGLGALMIFSDHLHVYLDQSDDHTDYLINALPAYHSLGLLVNFSGTDTMLPIEVKTRNRDAHSQLSCDESFSLSADTITVRKDMYPTLEGSVRKLRDFLRIFKYDLKDIEIDKKEDSNSYVCSLIMVYDTYQIHAEFESTGIKKLIRLFMYLKEMVSGGIVFIDEFDSNLHDVYLCALLEYLMEYGKGQLCFTTHNVGPMDILKTHKKSIDFLSEDHKIYPWIHNGNYSPARLYRNGMIEGSPFNVDSIDFIGIFDSIGEDDTWDYN